MMKSLFIEPLMTEADAAVMVSAAEREQAQGFGSEHRRREFLSWRALVHRELGATVEIAYNAIGAPVLINSNLYLGVSHCRDWVAVCISDAPCAVDIESRDRNFDRVASRYLSADERALSSNPLWPAVVWCAKETLYKFSGLTELDFLVDLHVEAVDFSAGTLRGRIRQGEPLELSLRCGDDLIATYIF